MGLRNKATILFMSVFKVFLLPFAFVYDMITRIRNRMYDTGWKPSVSFDIPLISVGNLSVGGTGKTPMVEYLIRLISPTQKVGTLSRGYKRKTKGFRIASPNDNAVSIGDEPYQLFTKYNNIVVSVCEDRAFAIPHILDQHPDTEVILLDDAFQHRRVKPGFSILLTEYSSPFFSDYVLPYGRLREHARGAGRADVIVVTKCPPQLSDEEYDHLESGLRKFSSRPLFFSSLVYNDPKAMLGNEHTLSRQVVLVSGIANHVPLEEYVKRNFTLVKHFVFRDHHQYTDEDIRMIEKFLNQLTEPVSILTTEKDKVKLESVSLRKRTEKLPFFYLPIEMEFVKNGKDFDALVLESLSRG